MVFVIYSYVLFMQLRKTETCLARDVTSSSIRERAWVQVFVVWTSRHWTSVSRNRGAKGPGCTYR